MKPPFTWDAYSDQRHVVKDRRFKNAMKRRHFFDYCKLVCTAFATLPLATVLMHFLKGESACRIGLCVNLDKGDIQHELVRELGVRELSLRVPLWDIDNLDKYVQFTHGFDPESRFLIVVMQDRENIEDLDLFKQNITRIFEAFNGIAQEFQIGNAINRSKWGFFAVSEYLEFYLVAYNVRNKHFPNLKLLGPSVIDFEYYYTARALFNRYQLKFDKLSSLLYVDRRGAPQNRQYMLFNTLNKINLLYALARLSNKTTDDIYITEVNWPLKNTAPYAPTSERECVTEDEYAIYMHDYLLTACRSKKISKVYWHQLIAPGYGLIDNRNGNYRKTRAFFTLTNLLKVTKNV